jgi:hypothetical protein
MNHEGWKQLLDGWPWFRGEGSFPILPNSEFMPPVRVGLRPYGSRDSLSFSEDDPWGWPINEYEEAFALRPGLHDIAQHVLDKLVPLCRGDEAHGICASKLRQNPHWPSELAERSHALEHERFVLLLPLALSMTQDDRAHVRWTLFGNSEQGPARALWKSFYTAPGQEMPAEQALDFFRDLLSGAYEEPRERFSDLRAAGFRILPVGVVRGSASPEGRLPSWTADYILGDREPMRGVRHLLTFRPFREIPAPIRKKYLAGELHLLPFPGSLLFWGVSGYRRLAETMRLAAQVPLLHLMERHEASGKIRIPQCGWFREAGPSAPDANHGHGPFRETYKRTSRHIRAHRHADPLVSAREHRLTHVLFSTRPRDIDLYHKPMARNVQLWTHDFLPLLDGPASKPDDIRRAAETIADGGMFGYRFVFPAMRVGRHEMYWHRPLVAFLNSRTHRPVVVDSAPPGYFTAYLDGEPDFEKPLELWPRLLKREPHALNVELFKDLKEKPPLRTLTNVSKILDAWERFGRQPLSQSFARQLLTIPKEHTLEGWLRSLPSETRHRDKARRLADLLRACLAPAEAAPLASRKKEVPPSLTFEQTATREFEVGYWNTIAELSAGHYVNKNNADCVLDKTTQAALAHPWRDLESMGDHVLGYYARLVALRGMREAVLYGELPFRWHTEYPFPWMGGWLSNQEGKTYERNLLVMIPGRDRTRAVVMADHYDTAYMHDCYDAAYGGYGARLAAPGADDNCSATAALMLGAPAFLELSRQGKLACDVWLLHLTGEEYPAEGLGACRVCQWLVEGTLSLHAIGGGRHDLSGVQIQGVYVLDMIAHNINKDRDVFQIAPGASRESLWLAYQAHLANRTWNLAADVWNREPSRRRAARGRRSREGKKIPPLARFLPLYGEVRPHFDTRSTLFNTDGQMFSDVGIPVALFMENYDINRVGYHDTHDNMSLINLDYGAAFAAITIESVARAATEEPPAA